MTLLGFEGALLLVILVSALLVMRRGFLALADKNVLLAISCVFLALLIVFPLTITLRAAFSMLFAVFALTAAVAAVIEASENKEGRG